MSYTIQSGDTLSGIASKYNTDINTLLQLNPTITDPNKIYAGSQLNLPTNQTSPTTVTTNQIPTTTTPVTTAPVTTNTQTIQQQTASQTPTASTYTVKSGDSLSKIAAQYNMTLTQLLQYNPQFQSNPNLIQPGQTVNLGPASELGIPTSLSGSATLPNSSTPIDASSLGQGTMDLSKVLGVTIPSGSVNSDIAGLLSLYGASSDAQKNYDSTANQLESLMSSLGNEGADLQTAMDANGVGAAYAQVKELNLKGAQLKGELDKFDAETQAGMSQIENQQIPTGLITGQQAQYQKQRDLTRLSKAAELSATIALSQAYQGNANLGLELAQKAVDLKYQPILNQIDVLKTQLGIASDNLSRSDSARSKIISELLTLKENDIATAKDSEMQIQNIAIQAAANQAPLSVVNAIQSASDVVTATSLASQWLKSNTTVSSGSGSGSGSSTTKSIFTTTQINKGAANAGIPIADFSQLSDDSKNYYINSYSKFQTALNNVAKGTEDAAADINEIQSSNLPQDVKDNLVNKLQPYVKQSSSGGGFLNSIGGFFGNIWQGIQSFF